MQGRWPMTSWCSAVPCVSQHYLSCHFAVGNVKKRVLIASELIGVTHSSMGNSLAASTPRSSVFILFTSYTISERIAALWGSPERMVGLM